MAFSPLASVRRDAGGRRRSYGSINNSNADASSALGERAVGTSSRDNNDEERELLISPPLQPGDDANEEEEEGVPPLEESTEDETSEGEEILEDEDEVAQPRETETPDDLDDALNSLTRRLRCLFSVVTWPIVPLGTICILGLLWLLYASFALDMNKSCSHPLHWYSSLSLVFLLYLPFHTSIRSYFFHYDRDRDGPNRPASVRRYDQCFNTVALLYVYCGITLVQTCRDDLLQPDGTAEDGATLDMASLNNTCTATCPNTFASLRVYVACLELFVLSLIVPLLFLPCLYLYFVRRTMQDAEVLSILQDRLRDEEAVRRNGGITADEILEYFELVQLIKDPRSVERKILIVPRVAADDDDGDEEASEEADVNVPSSIDFDKARECDTKECCICMKTFKVQGATDIEMGDTEDRSEDWVVRTSQTCGHLFHQRCIASWVGGRWESSGSEERRPARHTTCPLCRRDFRPNR